jgi:hypothetical protein
MFSHSREPFVCTVLSVLTHDLAMLVAILAGTEMSIKCFSQRLVRCCNIKKCGFIIENLQVIRFRSTSVYRRTWEV